MKKILFLLLLPISSFAQFQQPGRKMQSFGKVDIQPKEVYLPIQAQFYSPIKDTAITMIAGFEYNLLDSAVFHVILLNKNNRAIMRKDVGMSASDYSSWDGENNTAFQYIADKLPVTLK